MCGRNEELNHPRFFERLMQTQLVHSFYSASGNGNAHIFFEFRNINASLLKVWVATAFAGGVKLRRAGSVAVTAADL